MRTLQTTLHARAGARRWLVILGGALMTVGFALPASSQAPTPIAAIQDDPAAYVDAFVTIEATVYIRTNFNPFGSANGYVQDSSGRGVDVFGTGADDAVLRAVGNRVRLTGEVKIVAGSTVGITNLQAVSLLGTASTTPIRLGTLAAADAAWEGTYIAVNGVIQSSTSVSGGRNYVVDDGSGTVVVRVLGAVRGSTIPNGTRITARGAGSASSDQRQILVGAISDLIENDTPGADTTPPILIGAWVPASRDEVRLTFDETLDPATGGNTTNYSVIDTAMPSSPFPISTASVSGPLVDLALGSQMGRGVTGRVEVAAVQDTTGNAIVSPVTLDFMTPVGDVTPPTLVSARNVDPTSVEVRFSEAVDPVTGGDTTNYSVFVTATPANTVAVSSATVNGDLVTLALGASLSAGTGYTVEVQNVQDLEGNAVVGSPTATFTTPPAATPIATIQNNVPGFLGQVVTVEGQVYVPANYRGGTPYSGYIQDGSGRGINLFGSGANNPALNNVSNIVRVTGTVTLYYTTVEIDDITQVTLISPGNPELQPTVLSTDAAADPAWEGTYIQVTGDITAKATSGPGLDYTVTDGSGPIIVRVVDALPATEFNVGQHVTARGAGGQYQSNFQVNVGRATDVFVAGGGPDTTPPTLVRAAAATATRMDVSFSEALDEPSAETIANYLVFETATPANTIAVTAAVLQSNQRDVQLSLGASLVDGRGYSVRVNNVRDLAGNSIAANATATLTYSASGITSIAEIQQNVAGFTGRQVTVEAQVYIPWDYRDTVVSGYVQDASGRGINIFGFDPLPNDLLDLGVIARITGTVDLYNTTVELADITNVVVVSRNNPPLLPTPLTIAAAANAQWEGTFIQVTGEIVAKAVGGPGLNYTLSDGGINTLIVRVVTALGAPEFNVSQTVTARGAGGKFGNDFQILVGTPNGFFEGAPTEDIFPPALESAVLLSPTQVQLRFNEALEATSATEPNNYEVFRTANASQIVTVQSVTPGSEPGIVILLLAAAIDVADGWSVRVRNVRDLAGNAIPAFGTPARAIKLPSVEVVTLTGPARTFLPRLGEAYTLTFTVPSGIAAGNGEILLRIFDLTGRLRRTLFDSHFEDLATTIVDNRAEVSWNGRDNFADWVGAGTYVAHLLVVDNRTGKRNEAQIPVVVATRLDR